LAFDYTQDAFDWIQPRRIGWHEEQLNANPSNVLFDRFFVNESEFIQDIDRRM